MPAETQAPPGSTIAALQQKVDDYERWFRTLDRQVRALETERRKLAAVVNHTDVAFFSVDPQLTVTWVNRAFIGCFGDPTGTSGRILGFPCHQFVCRQDEPCASCPGRLALDQGRVLHQEMRLEVGGSEHHVYATAMPIHSPEGAVVEVMVMLQDLTGLEALRRSEEALRLKSEQLGTLADAMTVFLQSGDCGAASSALLSGVMAQTGSGYGFAAVLLEGPCLRIIAEQHAAGLPPAPAPADRDLREREIDDLDRSLCGVLSAGTTVSCAEPALGLRLERLLAGHPPLESFAAAPIRREGQVLGLIAVGNRPGGYGEGELAKLELTAQMAGVLYATYRQKLREEALEEQLRQSQKMEAVGRLAGGVAHDFNNLLTGISCWADLLLQSLGSADPRAEHAAEIRKAADRAATMTRQLLSFSRKQAITPGRLDLNEVVTDMGPMLRRLIGENIELEAELAGDARPVRADRGQMEQVLLNLVVNARDAMSGGGRITIETRNHDLADCNSSSTMHPGAYTLLLVTDTGCGMDAETRLRIFEPFFTTKEPGRGTGLGLSTVYAIVRQSGGHLRVRSQPGRGATFSVFLPEAGGPAEIRDAPVATRALPLRAGGFETILLVEDEELVRRAARRILESSGYTVIEAPSGPSALRLSLREPGRIHLLLTDVIMPQMSGREVATRIEVMRPDTRVLYLSGHSDEAVLRFGVEASSVPFLPKPFTAESLTHKVRDVLDGV